MKADRMYVIICMLSLIVKVCLWGGYHSTDFEVHRNWMAITYHMPLRKWYFEDTSIWTLDYPPFFAYFEWILAKFAVAIYSAWEDPVLILKISESAVISESILLFQRSTVIVCDFVLLFATAKYLSVVTTRYRYTDRNKDTDTDTDGDTDGSKNKVRSQVIIFALVVLNAGLLLVDHIHFQYNGLLLGILILCLSFAQRCQYPATAITFSILVLMKHLFVTLVPLFVVYFWCAYCAPRKVYSTSIDKIKKLGRLVLIALMMLVAAIGPLIWNEISNNGPHVHTFDEISYLVMKQIGQLLTRLLPFGRGLVHTYWAPNVWALYYASDRAAMYLFTKIGMHSSLLISNANAVASVSGVLGDVHPVILPAISAKLCLILTFLSMTPALAQIYKKPTGDKLVESVVYCSLCAFMLGYHVHEKAILVPLVIQTLLIFTSHTQTTQASREGKGGIPSAMYLFIVLTVAGIFGLFPLFGQIRELLIKTVLYVVYVTALVIIARTVSISIKDENRNGKNQAATAVYYQYQFPLWLLLAIFGVLHVYNQFGHAYFEAYIGRKLEFLPLMLTSIVSAVFLGYAWVLSLQQLF